MTVSSPVIEWRQSVTPFTPLSSIAFSGTGFGGSIPVGTASTPLTVRVYNNFAAAVSVANALNCVLTTYDDAVHQGLASTQPTTNKYVQVQVLDYNGTVTHADATYFAIGGSTKHPIPVNSGTIGGTGSNYVTLSVKVVIPANATQGSVGQGLWIEYSSTA